MHDLPGNRTGLSSVDQRGSRFLVAACFVAVEAGLEVAVAVKG